MFGRGWTAIIRGLILLGITTLMYHEAKDSNNEAKKIIEEGYQYAGQAVITEGQFNQIKQYGGVQVISLDPLEVKYRFTALENYPFLNSERFSGSIRGAVGVWETTFLLLFVIPLFAIISGIMDLTGGSNNIPAEQEKKT